MKVQNVALDFRNNKTPSFSKSQKVIKFCGFCTKNKKKNMYDTFHDFLQVFLIIKESKSGCFSVFVRRIALFKKKFFKIWQIFQVNQYCSSNCFSRFVMIVYL